MSKDERECNHTGFESNVCDVCGYPDPSKMIASLKQQIASLKYCGNCTSYYIKWCDGEEMKDFKTVIEYKTSISGLEKIEPMKIALGSFIGDTFGQETRLAEKLNQVIENQNKIIDYLNQQVKK